jgi:hypothetical protein
MGKYPDLIYEYFRASSVCLQQTAQQYKKGEGGSGTASNRGLLVAGRILFV